MIIRLLHCGILRRQIGQDKGDCLTAMQQPFPGGLQTFFLLTGAHSRVLLCVRFPLPANLALLAMDHALQPSSPNPARRVECCNAFPACKTQVFATFRELPGDISNHCYLQHLLQPCARQNVPQLREAGMHIRAHNKRSILQLSCCIVSLYTHFLRMQWTLLPLLLGRNAH